MVYRIGVDIGGSFTDFAVLDERDNSIRTLKVLSRPDQPGNEIRTGLSSLQERYHIAPGEVSYFTHGTTVGINSVIQRHGVKLALFTTENFQDVLEVARLKIPHIHDLFSRRPAPLIPRDMVFPIAERTDRNGRILKSVDRDSVVAAVEGALDAGAEGIVVSLLHSYRNGENEARVRDIVAEFAPQLLTSCSAEIWPIIREYERTITATINAYVQPKVISYLESFETALTEMGVSAPPLITKSNGGVMAVQQAKAECVQMILSGTASGVIGASFIAEACDFPKLLSMDIGGTSADVAVIENGEAQYGTGEIIGDFQIHIPSVSVTSVGQGGGSIAWIDDLGVLCVGPDSAGSLPGPVCYQRGGTRPTVTDAFVVCGMIGHGDLGYNAVKVDVDASRRAMADLAGPLGISIEETAENIIQIATSSMYTGVSGLLSRFGIDPREYHFLAFGGAGPMMTCFLAREMNMKGVIVPPTPGVLSALGGLVADLKNDFIQTLFADLTPELSGELRDIAKKLADDAISWLEREHGKGLDYRLSFLSDMRYRGQSFEIEVPLEQNWIEQDDFAAIRSAFDAQHEKLFGHADSTAPVQIISLRLVIASPTPKPRLLQIATGIGRPEPHGNVNCRMDGQSLNVPLYLREKVLAAQVIPGPAIIAQDDTTTCVPPGMQVDVDPFGNLIITPKTN
ncbi:hydantoinase/oxoprolinase family protein [Hoeflea prorocentri]|uniref:Hydantoinase/oxoprolinase family protein n=1 Tax=Hoeflea prorocentri TaxID=1922333 RepID=A0A9X3UDF8_9HYPH|nr:hydantoinase/oxoprolinase family protein [Hoeflea prorocentri]MCY6379382.1 hydantoinase/oxoprolinase family protein [Hoeflea prorocentri]MDA5397183.1 hydantoinase/oxoprolinase family protein [Hoeflea prorocentri]